MKITFPLIVLTALITLTNVAPVAAQVRPHLPADETYVLPGGTGTAYFDVCINNPEEAEFACDILNDPNPDQELTCKAHTISLDSPYCETGIAVTCICDINGGLRTNNGN